MEMDPRRLPRVFACLLVGAALLITHEARAGLLDRVCGLVSRLRKAQTGPPPKGDVAASASPVAPFHPVGGLDAALDGAEKYWEFIESVGRRPGRSARCGPETAVADGVTVAGLGEDIAVL